MPDDTPILPGLSPVDNLPIHAKFDGGAMSSNGGALLLREAGRSRRLSALLASCIADARDPSRVVHSYETMIQSRMKFHKSPSPAGMRTATTSMFCSLTRAATRAAARTRDQQPFNL